MIFRCLAVVPRSKIAAGVCGSIPSRIRFAHKNGSVETPIRNTSVPFTPASSRNGISSGSCPSFLCAVIMCSEEAAARCVTGIPWYAGTDTADVTPGTISNGIPAFFSSSASSAPRPNTNGSPPFKRTTFFPSIASLTRIWLISLCLTR